MQAKSSLLWCGALLPLGAAATSPSSVPRAPIRCALVWPYPTKQSQCNPADAFGYGTIKDLTMMRLGETYLLLTEARFKQGNPSGASASLNALRTRPLAGRATRLNGASITSLPSKNLLPIPQTTSDLTTNGNLPQNPGC